MADSDSQADDTPPSPVNKRKRAKTLLPWMSVPASVDTHRATPLTQVHGLPQPLSATLRQSFGFSSLLPVQAAAWRSLCGGVSDSHDLCIAAPTGSGKTLAYALPLLTRLLLRPSSGRVRAIVVLPTKVLAAQVHHVFSQLLRDVPHLSALLINGSRSVREELSLLLTSSLPHSTPSLLALLPALHNVSAAAAPESIDFSPSPHRCLYNTHPSELPAEQNGDAGQRCAGKGCIRVDGHGERPPSIAIVTPGRLVQHLQALQADWLQELDFLVVDESDRLLRQDYHGWLASLLAAVAASSGGSNGSGCRRLVKVLVSATLTHDPSKLAKLQLRAPRFIAIKGGEQSGALLPPNLAQWQLVTAATTKPHALVALLASFFQGPGGGERDEEEASLASRERGGSQKVVVFSSSVEATHRLALLLGRCCGAAEGVLPAAPAVEFSSRLTAKQQAAALKSFAACRSGVLVASDGMTRGMDLPGVNFIVNYDMPVHMRTYVHRAGRCARAGASGAAYSILRKEQVGAWKRMMRGAGNKGVQDHRISEEDWEGVRDVASRALQGLRDALLAEEV